MLIAKMVLCASILMLGGRKESGQKPESNGAQNAAQAPAPQAAGQQAQSAEAADKAEQPSTKQPELEEKEINGVKLVAIEAHVVSYTNQERARYGLPPLEVDKELMETAREHCAWMTRNRTMVHTRRPVAENIAMGQPHSSDVVRAWMNSSGHRANILNAGHRRIGVAAFRTESGTIFWCQQFRR